MINYTGPSGPAVSLCEKERRTNTDCKVGDKHPLLHGLVVGGLAPHQTEVKGQPGVIRAHNHGGQR